MATIKTRLQKLEDTTGQGIEQDELLAARINRVLQIPELISPAGYARLLQILENCKARQAATAGR